jgi:hypothetical protein
MCSHVEDWHRSRWPEGTEGDRAVHTCVRAFVAANSADQEVEFGPMGDAQTNGAETHALFFSARSALSAGIAR